MTSRILLYHEINRAATTQYDSERDRAMGFSCEQRLKQALRTAGLLISVIEPLENGKQLCKQVIKPDSLVEISGTDFNVNIDIWLTVASKAGLMSGVNSNVGANWVLSKDTIIRYCIDNNKALVITDFHCAAPKLQKEIAYQVKDAIRKGLKIVMLLPTQEVDSILRRNADMSGRMSVIGVDSV